MHTHKHKEGETNKLTEETIGEKREKLVLFSVSVHAQNSLFYRCIYLTNCTTEVVQG